MITHWYVPLMVADGVVWTFTVNPLVERDVCHIAPTAVGSDDGVIAQLVGVDPNAGENVTACVVAGLVTVHVPALMEGNCDVHAKVPFES